MHCSRYLSPILLLISCIFLINCSEEEAPSSSASSPAAPSNYGKGGDVLIDPTDGSWVSSKPTFVITFSDLARSVITDSVSYPGKPNSRLNSFQGSTLCLRASSNSNCENLSVIFNDNLTTATVTPLNSLNEGDYTFLIAGSILTSAGSLGEDQTFRYEVIFPNGGAIQNSLSLGTNAIPFKNLDLDGPRGLATNGTYLYVADTYKEKIKKITLSSSAINSFNLNSLPVESGESPEIRTLLEPAEVQDTQTVMASQHSSTFLMRLRIPRIHSSLQIHVTTLSAGLTLIQMTSLLCYHQNQDVVAAQAIQTS